MNYPKFNKTWTLLHDEYHQYADIMISCSPMSSSKQIKTGGGGLGIHLPEKPEVKDEYRKEAEEIKNLLEESERGSDSRFTYGYVQGPDWFIYSYRC